MAYDPTLVLDMRSMTPFMDGATQRVRDFSGYGNHGTPTNFAGDDSEYVDEDIGQAVLLDGANKSLNCGNSAQLNNNHSLSFEAIIRTTDADGYIIGKGSAGDFQFGLRVSVGVALVSAFTAAGGNYFSAAGVRVINDNNPHHVIGTIQNGVEAIIYVDGTPDGIDNTPAGTWNLFGAINMTIGQRGDASNYLAGRINRIKIWNRVLGTAEVYNRYINRFRV